MRLGGHHVGRARSSVLCHSHTELERHLLNGYNHVWGVYMPTNIELAEKVEWFQNSLISWATGGQWDETAYKASRDELISTSPTKEVMPRFMHYCGDLHQFWSFIKGISPTYKGRREYLWAEFRPVIDGLRLSCGLVSPSDQGTTETLGHVDSDFINEAWQTALRRRFEDPDGAVTAARSLVETVCKHILDDAGVTYKRNADLAELCHLTSATINLAPSRHSERAVKRVLGGIVVIIEGIGNLRNIFGDAHGKGRDGENPDVRHAEFAVNIAGTLCTFLISAWEAERPTA